MIFPQLIGQPRLKERIASTLEAGLWHAYLFLGPPGSGRRTFASAFCRTLLCHSPSSKGYCGKCKACIYFEHQTHPDFKSLFLAEKEKNIKVENIRQLLLDLSTQPQLGRYKIYLIDGDSLNEQGQNALLKSLEEPPHYAVFILMSSGVQKLLPTVLSRLVVLPLQRYSQEELAQILLQSGHQESAHRNFIVRYANGIPGRALELASNEQFNLLREEALQFFLDIRDSSRTNLLTGGYGFFEQRKDDSRLIFSLLSGLVRDLLLLSEVDKDMLVNQDVLPVMEEFFYELGSEAKNKLGKCYDVLQKAELALINNVSYEVLICQLLLSLRKELTNAKSS